MSSRGKAKAPKRRKKDRPEHMLIRFGGMGDTMFLTAVARVLSEKQSVTMAIPEHQHGILDGNPHVDRIVPLRRFGPYPFYPDGRPVNLYGDKHGDWRPIEHYFQQLQTGEIGRKVRVTDYYGIIEGNGRNPTVPMGNSGYAQVYDLHLAWAGIDPTRIPDDYKRPVYIASSREREWAADLMKSMPKPVIMWQGHGSAPAKSYYRNNDDIARVLKATGGTVIAWAPDTLHWTVWGREMQPIIGPDWMMPIRLSGALVSQADLTVTADTFVSHLAEALEKRHVTFYATFSADGYSRYYKHERTVDLIAPDRTKTQPCKCHVISEARCPRREEDARRELAPHKINILAGLTPQQKQKAHIPMDIKPVDASDDPGPKLHPQFAGGYVNSVVQEFHGLRFAEPYCMEGFDLAGEVLDELGVSE